MKRFWQECQVVDIIRTELTSKLLNGFLALNGQLAKRAVGRLILAMLNQLHVSIRVSVDGTDQYTGTDVSFVCGSSISLPWSKRMVRLVRRRKRASGEVPGFFNGQTSGSPAYYKRYRQ